MHTSVLVCPEIRLVRGFGGLANGRLDQRPAKNKMAKHHESTFCQEPPTKSRGVATGRGEIKAPTNKEVALDPSHTRCSPCVVPSAVFLFFFLDSCHRPAPSFRHRPRHRGGAWRRGPLSLAPLPSGGSSTQVRGAFFFFFFFFFVFGFVIPFVC